MNISEDSLRYISELFNGDKESLFIYKSGSRIFHFLINILDTMMSIDLEILIRQDGILPTTNLSNYGTEINLISFYP